MSKIQNPVQGWPAAIRVHGIWQLETQGYPRLQGYHCEEMTQRTPGSLFKCCDVSPKKTSYGLGWTRKHPNTQKRTWSKLIFLYCSTLLLNNPISYLHLSFVHLLSVTNQIRSVVQSCLTLCDRVNRSTPGLPVHHQLPEFTETHVHRVNDAIQPSHPLSSPSPPAPNPSQNQSLFQWVNSLHEVAKVLAFQL